MKTVAAVLLATTLSTLGCSRKAPETTDPAPKQDAEGRRGAGPSPAAPKDSEAAREVRNLRGRWTGTAEFNGRRMNLFPNLAVEDDRITRTFDMKPNGKSFDLVLASFEESKQVTYTWAFDLDPSARPAAINLRNLDGESKGKVFPGIYLRDGDTLKLCFNPTGGERPARFASVGTGADGAILMVLGRSKK